MTKENLKRYSLAFLNFFQTQWKKWKPEIVREIIAIFTIASFFKIVLQNVPIIFSVLTVLATLPIASYFFQVFSSQSALTRL